jgi:hypothetical protein
MSGGGITLSESSSDDYAVVSFSLLTWWYLMYSIQERSSYPFLGEKQMVQWLEGRFWESVTPVTLWVCWDIGKCLFFGSGNAYLFGGIGGIPPSPVHVHRDSTPNVMSGWFWCKQRNSLNSIFRSWRTFHQWKHICWHDSIIPTDSGILGDLWQLEISFLLWTRKDMTAIFGNSKFLKDIASHFRFLMIILWAVFSLLLFDQQYPVLAILWGFRLLQ